MVKIDCIILLLIMGCGCNLSEKRPKIQDVQGKQILNSDNIWLSHEHILVDFIGADSIQPDSWNHDSIIKEITPYFEELKAFNVKYFVDATPNYLGRDALLLEKIAIKIRKYPFDKREE